LAEGRLLPAVTALERALASVGARHMLIGGVAVIARGVRRLTDDVDATIWADGTDLDALLAALAEQAILPRIDDAVTFAQRTQVLLLRHDPSGVDIDLSLAWLPFEDEALARASDVRLGDRGIPVASPDDLVVYKAIAARERDRSDVERLLELHGRTMALDRVRALVRQLSDALERPELLDDLEALIRRVSARADRE
jgi:predicted nucleotidyltransferase